MAEQKNTHLKELLADLLDSMIEHEDKKDESYCSDCGHKKHHRHAYAPLKARIVNFSEFLIDLCNDPDCDTDDALEYFEELFSDVIDDSTQS